MSTVTGIVPSADRHAHVLKVIDRPQVFPHATHGSDTHIRISDWQDVVKGSASPDRARVTVAHIESCPTCSQLVAALPPPPYYSLGRPLPPIFSIPPSEVAAQVNDLLTIVQSRLDTGGVIRPYALR